MTVPFSTSLPNSQHNQLYVANLHIFNLPLLNSQWRRRHNPPTKRVRQSSNFRNINQLAHSTHGCLAFAAGQPKGSWNRLSWNRSSAIVFNTWSWQYDSSSLIIQPWEWRYDHWTVKCCLWYNMTYRDKSNVIHGM